MHPTTVIAYPRDGEPPAPGGADSVTGQRLARVRNPVGWTVAAGVASSGVALALTGASGAASAAAATVVVVGFLWTGTLPVRLVAWGTPAMSAAILLLTYTLRLALAVAVIRGLGAVTELSPSTVGITVVGCALVWSAAALGAAVHSGATDVAAVHTDRTEVPR